MHNVLIDPNDELAAALACRKLRDALLWPRGPRGRPLATSVRTLLSPLGKLQWGVACGAPLSESLFALVARFVSATCAC
jgi:hypothetical protein